jgi:hypothetical protein
MTFLEAIDVVIGTGLEKIWLIRGCGCLNASNHVMIIVMSQYLPSLEVTKKNLIEVVIGCFKHHLNYE